ncbi:MAG: glycyl-radical enzyme activating protein [candidate division WOR-3 bacterium]
MRIFNIQRFSVEDGPGIRTTVFLKGCPLRCLWCSNPESQSGDKELAYRDSLCKHCGTCVKACPNKVINIVDNFLAIDRNKCNACGACVDVCPQEALKIFGKDMTIDEVMEEVMKDVMYYHISGGGVTASGGEPLMQADAVAELFRKCRAVGIHTVLDTSGYADSEKLRRVLKWTNLVLFDIKLLDTNKHRAYTGIGNEVILENAKLIAEYGVPMIIRVPLVPTINDSKEELTAIGEFIRKLGVTVSVEILPYHRLGVAKYKMLGKKYQLDSIPTPTKEDIEKALAILKEKGIIARANT